MKLYYSPGACSLASHITLHELGIPFEGVKVDLQKMKTAAGQDFNSINPKRYVPTLALDDGTYLTEGPVIMQYLADRKPDAGLVPPAGMARYRLQEMLGFINSEVHKGFSPLFADDSTDAVKKAAKEKLAKKFDYLEGLLSKSDHVLGGKFTIADAYLYTVLNWSSYVGIDLGGWPSLKQYHSRISARASVKAAHQAEE